MAVAARGQLNFEEVPGGCRGVDSFQKLRLLGQGAYGEVSLAKEKKTGEVVALKKLKFDKENYEIEGFPLTAIREIMILNKLRHENIIKLKEIVTSPVRVSDAGDIFMVFEYMDHDLTGLSRRFTFSVPQIKCYMSQLLKGLHCCHANGVLHRDIKSSNLLVNNEGSLKLGDFGLARTCSAQDCQTGKKLTNEVVTLWYRPPELLLGAERYGPAIDMWSAGCIFAELLCHGRPIFNGNTEAEMMTKIVEVCGAPNEVNWPGVSKLPKYSTYLMAIKPEQKPKRPLSEIFRHCDGHALELLEKLLTFDPSKRISAKDALDADYFWTDPFPCDPKSLPKYESSHELDLHKPKQQPLPNEENAAKRRKPVEYQQQHPRVIPPLSHKPNEEDASSHDLDLNKRKQQPLPNEENAAKRRKPVEYQQQHPRVIPPLSHKPNEEDASSHDLDLNKRKQQPLPNEENAAKRRKPVEYQQQHPPQVIPPPSHKPNEEDAAKSRKPDEENATKCRQPVRYEQQHLRTPPRHKADEENAAKNQKRVLYEQQHPRTTPPRHQQCGKKEVHYQPYRPSYRPQPQVAKWPPRHYDGRPPRPSDGARRYHQNDRYEASRWDSKMRAGRYHHSDRSDRY